MSLRAGLDNESSGQMTSRIDAAIGKLALLSEEDFPSAAKRTFIAERSYFLGLGLSPQDAGICATAIVAHAVNRIKGAEARGLLRAKLELAEVGFALH